MLGFLKFFPTCFALCNGKADSTSNVVPVRPEAGISFEFHEANVCIAIPSVPISLFVEGWRRLARVVVAVVKKRRSRMLVRS